MRRIINALNLNSPVTKTFIGYTIIITGGLYLFVVAKNDAYNRRFQYMKRRQAANNDD